MKTIVCFGDSNTYGYNPENNGRFKYGERWTGILQQKLGNGYRVVEEGLNGRTTVFDDPIEGDKSGKNHLMTCIYTHSPIDLLIIFLGANDLKTRFCLTVDDIALGADCLVKMAGNVDQSELSRVSRILLISPVPLKTELADEITRMFGTEELREKSMLLAPKYEEVAKSNNIAFLKGGDYASDVDGIHLSGNGHSLIAGDIHSKIIEMGV